MKITSKNFNREIKKFQEGGEMAAEGGAPVEAAPAEGAPTEGGDPMEQILMACQQALETQDCNLAMQICQAIIQMAGGGAQEAPAAPEGAAPVYKKGGRLAYWTRK